jgi:hypothetical protein
MSVEKWSKPYRAEQARIEATARDAGYAFSPDHAVDHATHSMTIAPNRFRCDDCKIVGIY